jgi:hypothetical protein
MSPAPARTVEDRSKCFRTDTKTGDPDLMVYVDLIYRAWRAKGKTFPMPNTKGVSRKTKTRILLALERAGLITVEWRRFKSPVVTLIVSIF